MRRIEEWLGDLGLGEYASRFAENHIDLSIVRDLTDQDLKDLGIASIGHRRKLLKAISEQKTSPAEAALVAVPSAVFGEAERRQLTVMFCDLVGSTTLSARLDPEDLREVIGAYQGACARIITSYEGFVAKFMGDGVLAYFGFPRAHEDDAERAVRTGLEIIKAIAKVEIRHEAKLAVRIGIATGLVVVGDLIGEGSSAQEQAVVGETPNLASRLQAIAEPGNIVIAGSTRRLLGDLFRYRNLGRGELKGFNDPVETWAVEGLSSLESRFEAAHSSRMSNFVGRENEGALLLDKQRLALRGQGQIVLISGEPGIGKSRFVTWVAEKLETEPHIRLRYQCSPFHRDSALYPFVQQLERAAHIATEDPTDAKLDKLEAMLGLAADTAKEIAPLFASLLSIPSGDRYPPLNLTPAQQRRRTLGALLDQMEGLARKQPILLIFEDIHWADATSLEVLDLAVERLRSLPVIALMTFRPEYEAPWAGMSHVASLALTKLDASQVETLAERIAGRRLPHEVLEQIIAKTDGIPLFVEELTKTVQESGLLVDAGDQYQLDRPLPPLAIPSTLQDSLMARLDRLAPVKEIAQVGAAIGREFSYDLLSAVSRRSEAALNDALTQLERAELVFCTGKPPDARYTFKHALVQDAAYESLLKSRRQVLHRTIAETLRDKFAASADSAPEIVAQHYTLAGMDEPAIEWWRKAGELALRRSALKEAITHLRKAIDMADRMAGDVKIPTKPEMRLQLQIGLANALLTYRGFAAPETSAAFARARELASGVNDPVERFAIYRGQFNNSMFAGDLAAVRELATVLMMEGEARPNTTDALTAHRLYGMSRLYEGDFVAARQHIEQSLVTHDWSSDREQALRYVFDHRAIGLTQLAWVLWPLGEVDRAREFLESGVTKALHTGHAATMVQALGIQTLIEEMQGDAIQAKANVERFLACAKEHGLKMWEALGTFTWHWLRASLGELDALSQMHEAVAGLRWEGIRLNLPLYLTVLANAEADAGRFDAATDTTTAALSEAEETGEHWYDAEAYRVRGRILFECNFADPTPAEQAFQTAIAIAQHQKARSFELRAALDLARLYHSTGRPTEAHTVLASALEGFSPTPEFPEIEEAQTLLISLKA